MFGNVEWFEWLVSIPVLLFSLSVHEFSHSFVAYRLGDYTQKTEGRMTLNPIKHIDWIGFLCLIFLRFGWAKPVSVNPNNFGVTKSGKKSSMKRGMALSSLAGPMSNFILAFTSVMIYYPLARIYYGSVYINFSQILSGMHNGVPAAVCLILLLMFESMWLNMVLGVFNLFPIPPLDGSKIFSAFLPDSTYFRFISGGRFQAVSMIIFIILIRTGITSIIMSPIIQLIYIGFYRIADMVFNFL